MVGNLMAKYVSMTVVSPYLSIVCRYLLPRKEAIISSSFVFLKFLKEKRSCPLALKSPAYSLTETFPDSLCHCVYLLLGEWAGLGPDNPIAFPVLAPRASVVLVLRFPA